VCGGGEVVGGGGWRKEIRVTVCADGLHVPIWNRTKNPLAIALSGVCRGLRDTDDGAL
jgi:hypothetical protein